MDKVLGKKEKLAQTQQAISQAEEKLAQTQQAISQAEEKLAILNQTYTANQNALLQTFSQVATSKQELTSIQSQMAKSKQELRSIQSQVAGEKKTLSALQETLDITQETIPTKFLSAKGLLNMTTSIWRGLSWQEQSKYARIYQTQYAREHKLELRKVYTISGVEFPMRLIPPGIYLIGSPEDEPWHQSNETQARITIADEFYIAETQLTQLQYSTLSGKNNSRFKGDSLPVESISWESAIEFCALLNKLSKKDIFRLPTEAEWEYMCRAGTTTPFNLGLNITPAQVNYNGDDPYNDDIDAPTGEYRRTTVACGSLPNQNPWGFYDTHGNVWEWCLDSWFESYTNTIRNTKRTLLNQYQNVTVGQRIIRGGSWSSIALRCLSAYRHYDSGPHDYVGCRLASVL